MNDRSTLYLTVLPFFLIPACMLVIAGYGWIGYATLTERPGYNGHLFYYYNLTRPQFYTYNFSTATIAVVLVALQVKYLIDDKTSVTLEYTHQFSEVNVIGSNYVFSKRRYADLPRNFTTADN